MNDAQENASPKPMLVAIDMGYGHLRPAHALAERLGVEVLEIDQPPLAYEDEQRLWRQIRRGYEVVSRTSQWRGIGKLADTLLEEVTAIPDLYPNRDLSSPSVGVRLFEWLIGRGLGRGMIEQMRQSGAPLLTTFYSPALIADGRCQNRIYCVVTDSDINRAWAPADTKNCRINYLVPSRHTLRRLRAYGVPEAQIEVTGFPLPHELLGGQELPTLKANLAERLRRLDPKGKFRRDCGGDVDGVLEMLPSEKTRRPPLLTFAVGGAGAQSELIRAFLPSVARSITRGRLRLALVAGVRQELAALIHDWIGDAGLTGALGDSVEIVVADTFLEYLKDFNDLLARSDILWTKPSEMTFFGALGLPLVFAPPVGRHEWYNRNWALEQGAGLKQHKPEYAADWLDDWLADGTLAAAAWSGFRRLPKRGLYRIVEAVR